MKKHMIALGLALSFAAHASAEVIDFESLAHEGFLAEAGSSYVEKGFQLVNASPFPFSVWGTTSPFYSGSTAMMNDNDAGVTTLTQVGGNLFSLQSIALATMYPGLSEDGAEVTFVGLRQGGETVSQTFLVADGAPQTFSFSGFTNLAAVSWTNAANYHQFDNINVAAVPEPETYAMLLAGLGLLGAAARRRRV